VPLPLASSMLSHPLLCFLQFLSRGSADVPALLVEVSREREAATTMEVAHVAMVLATKTFAQEAAAAHDSTTIRVKDAKDRAALVEREA
jgi:hypothetical protein